MDSFHRLSDHQGQICSLNLDVGVQQLLGHGGQAGVDLGHVGDLQQLVLVGHDGGQVASGVGVEVDNKSNSAGETVLPEQNFEEIWTIS